MREIRPSGSEGGVALTTPFLPLSTEGDAGNAGGARFVVTRGRTWKDSAGMVSRGDAERAEKKEEWNGLMRKWTGVVARSASPGQDKACPSNGGGMEGCAK